MPHYAVQTQEIFSKSEQYRKWEGGGNGVGSWGQQKQSGCPTQTIKVSWVPGKPAPLWLSSWGCSSPLELGRSALPFKKGTCKWNSHSAMTLDVQCGRLSLIHVQVHTTHSWLRACLSCPLTPITSQNSAACSPWQCFDMSTEPLQGHQLIFGSWTHLFQEGQFQFSVTLTSPLLNFEAWDKEALVLTVQLWPPVPWVSTWAFYINSPFRERWGKHVPWKLGHRQPFPHPLHRKTAWPPALRCLDCGLCPVIPEPHLIWSIWVTWSRTTWSGRTKQRLTNNLIVAPMGGGSGGKDPPLIRFFLLRIWTQTHGKNFPIYSQRWSKM